MASKSDRMRERDWMGALRNFLKDLQINDGNQIGLAGKNCQLTHL
ncbi:hypothetical protein [uncultured Nostoc sp.]